MTKTFTNPIYAVYEESDIIGHYSTLSKAQNVAKQILKNQHLEQKYEVLNTNNQLEPNHIYLEIHDDNTYQFVMTDPFNSISAITEDFYSYANKSGNPIVKDLPITTSLFTKIKEIDVH